MAKRGLFENIGRSITKPVGDLISGFTGAMTPGYRQQMMRQQKGLDLNMELQKIRAAFDAGQFEVATQMAQNLFAEDPNIAKFIQEQMGGELTPRVGYQGARADYLKYLTSQERDPFRTAEERSKLRGRLASRVPEGAQETKELKSLKDCGTQICITCFHFAFETAERFNCLVS